MDTFFGFKVLRRKHGILRNCNFLCFICKLWPKLFHKIDPRTPSSSSKFHAKVRRFDEFFLKNTLVNTPPKKNRKRLSIFKHTQVCKHLRNYTITVLQLQFYKRNFTSAILQALHAQPQSKCLLLFFLKNYHPVPMRDSIS
jgi:hypothetical protein